MDKLKTTLGPEDQQIIKAKYQSQQFGKMAWEDLNTWASVLLIKINVITGWIIPDESLEILVDQFRKKLTESYANCNPDEVEYAFRNFGTAVKDWGKQMNLSLIDEVMVPYLGRRFELSRVEEQKAQPIPQIENKEDMSMEAMTDWFNDVSKKIKDGKLLLEFVPPMLYIWMDENGNINKTNAEKHAYLERAVQYRYGKLIEEVQKEDSATNRYNLSEFTRMKDGGCFVGSEISILKTLAKQMILFEMVLNS